LSLNATDLGLFLAGFASWTISTLSAGGGSILIVAAITALLRGSCYRSGGNICQYCCQPGQDHFVLAFH
jgi:uncharacterized membrane protein YfcA